MEMIYILKLLIVEDIPIPTNMVKNHRIDFLYNIVNVPIRISMRLVKAQDSQAGDVSSESQP